MLHSLCQLVLPKLLLPRAADHWERNTMLSLSKERDKLRTGKGNKILLREGQMGGGSLWPTWKYKEGAPLPKLPHVLPHQLLEPLQSLPFPFSPEAFICLIKVQLSEAFKAFSDPTVTMGEIHSRPIAVAFGAETHITPQAPARRTVGFACPNLSHLPGNSWTKKKAQIEAISPPCFLCLGCPREKDSERKPGWHLSLSRPVCITVWLSSLLWPQFILPNKRVWPNHF